MWSKTGQKHCTIAKLHPKDNSFRGKEINLCCNPGRSWLLSSPQHKGLIFSHSIAEREFPFGLSSKNLVLTPKIFPPCSIIPHSEVPFRSSLFRWNFSAFSPVCFAKYKIIARRPFFRWRSGGNTPVVAQSEVHRECLWCLETLYSGWLLPEEENKAKCETKDMYNFWHSFSAEKMDSLSRWIWVQIWKTRNAW